MKSTKIQYRSAQTLDVSALSALARLCFTDTFGHLYTAENLESHLQETCSLAFFSQSLQQDKIWVAEDAEQLIGYIKCGDMGLPVEPIPELSVEIQRLYIHPKYKRRGVGTALMQQALEDAMLKTAQHIYISVYEDNLPAQAFYQRYGFAKVGEYDYYVGSHIDREYIMHKKNS